MSKGPSFYYNEYREERSKSMLGEESKQKKKTVVKKIVKKQTVIIDDEIVRKLEKMLDLYEHPKNVSAFVPCASFRALSLVVIAA